MKVDEKTYSRHIVRGILRGELKTFEEPTGRNGYRRLQINAQGVLVAWTRNNTHYYLRNVR